MSGSRQPRAATGCSRQSRPFGADRAQWIEIPARASPAEDVYAHTRRSIVRFGCRRTQAHRRDRPGVWRGAPARGGPGAAALADAEAADHPGAGAARPAPGAAGAAGPAAAGVPCRGELRSRGRLPDRRRQAGDGPEAGGLRAVRGRRAAESGYLRARHHPGADRARSRPRARAEHRGAVPRDGGRVQGAALRAVPRHLPHLARGRDELARRPHPVSLRGARPGRPHRGHDAGTAGGRGDVRPPDREHRGDTRTVLAMEPPRLPHGVRPDRGTVHTLLPDGAGGHRGNVGDRARA